jgi:hypothetical protein
MALEITGIPSRIVLAFDSLNSLSESDHAESYATAFSTTLRCLSPLFSKNAKLVIPEEIVRYCMDKKVDIHDELALSNVATFERMLANTLYLADDYEIILEIRDDGAKYRLKCNSDPIVFQFEVVQE